ncbi:uncharacterized protein CRV24_007710 [Beauveria bassiana]|uniref:NAD dependent epimerase/dehydratase n=1 Tax=Beauveria bassiana (strain ARSEF 2860) TaxID=655819 RepID=J5K141_BEAB2|nr:NAD dependent epimerase/dehydratase [Beauveria bassiana ARSEF 2860]EJP70198.1 NAD dependent epimerase/dehydratase [Beauveria bassiana ARSEF 2860]KAF1731524.1 uncharacterized protein CRV24_007710 [Beauveria bassiana]KAH8715750.1 Uncharacterized protein HC256_004543 [Beauveria bassiana]
MAAAAKRLVVCGGNGFLGSRICKYAVGRGWDVISISRSGQPKWDNVTSSAVAPSWSHQVTWEKGDILKPASYAPFLQGADYVVHSMGILLEADYKGLVSGRESPIAGFQKAFAATKDRGINPLDMKPGEEIKPPNPNDQFSYEVMNRDSAVALARHASEAKTKAFCYISAAGGSPMLPQRYITTKRQAENTIATQFPEMRGVFIRPPFMFDESRKVTMGLAAMAGAGALFNKVTGGYLNTFMGAAGAKPVKVEMVAEAVVEALADENISGPIETPQMEELAHKAWRKTML